MLAFGVIVMGYVAYFAITLSVTPTVLISYLIAPTLGRGWRRVLSQSLLLFGLWPLVIGGMAPLVLAGTSGNAGTGLDFWGRSYDDMTTPALQSIYLAPAVIVLGEVVLFLLRRKPRPKPKEVAAVFGDDA